MAVRSSVAIAAREHPPGIPLPAKVQAAFRSDATALVRIVLAAALVFGVPFILFYRLILFHFYMRGSFLLDTGLLGSLMWHNTIALTLPPSLGGQSFFSTHVAPLLSLLSAMSWVLPVSMARMFGGFIGLCHGMLALALFWLLVQGHGLRRGWGLALAALAAIAFAFNGLALAVARYPHFEIFGAACLLLAFVALVLERPAIAGVSFLFALITREDIGLHAFGFLTTWLAVNWLRGKTVGEDRRRNAWLAGFAVAGLAYSSVVLLLQHRAYPEASSLVRVYLGQPALAHVTWRLVAMHGLGWIRIHSAILLPAAAALVWTLRTRDPFIIAGYVACIPWTLLHVLAVSPYAGWMVGYYAYPFLIALAWPLLAGVTPNGRTPDPSLKPAINLLAVVALSLVPLSSDFNPGKIPLPDAFSHPPSAEQEILTDRAVDAIATGRPVLGRLLVDRSVAGLRPLAFARDEIAGFADGPADTVVFFADGFDAVRLRASPGLPSHIEVPGTAIQISTNRPEATLRELTNAR